MSKLFSILFVLCALQTSQAAIQLKPLIETGLDSPVGVFFEPGNNRLFYVMEQKGQIVVWENGKLHSVPFLDIRKKVEFGGEKGLLGLAFHPRFSENGRFFINYTAMRPKLTTLVVERNKNHPEEKVILQFDQPYSNHNGGHLAFDGSGLLYISTGDGGSGGDPLNQGQNLNTLLGKILRIDVDSKAPYGIPKDNPFQEKNQRPEIFAWGLRNPWRFSFDKQTGALLAGDVGQNRYEEVDLIEKGGNYGWRTMEGFHCFKPDKNCATEGLTLPLVEYGREQGGSITGGYVYRGKRIPELIGIYVYGDFMSGNIWGLKYDFSKRKVVENKLLLKTELEIASFGEDPDGELYVVGYRGKIVRIEQAP